MKFEHGMFEFHGLRSPPRCVKPDEAEPAGQRFARLAPRAQRAAVLAAPARRLVGSAEPAGLVTLAAFAPRLRAAGAARLSLAGAGFVFSLRTAASMAAPR